MLFILVCSYFTWNHPDMPNLNASLVMHRTTQPVRGQSGLTVPAGIQCVKLSDSDLGLLFKLGLLT
jgi:hypothetical protein